MESSTLKLIKKVPIIVWLGLLSAIIIDTAVQMMWKTLIVQVPAGMNFMNAIKFLSGNTHLYFLLFLFVLQFFSWMITLSKADLTYVKPFTSISLVTVAVTAAIIFGERIGILRISGIILIISGVWLTSGSKHQTSGQETHVRGLS